MARQPRNESGKETRKGDEGHAGGYQVRSRRMPVVPYLTPCLIFHCSIHQSGLKAYTLRVSLNLMPKSLLGYVSREIDTNAESPVHQGNKITLRDSRFENGSKDSSYPRLIDFCITQHWLESNKEEKEKEE